MLKVPNSTEGALIKLQQFLDQRQLSRPRRYAVVSYGLIEQPQEIHGIFFLCDIFETYTEAQNLVDQIMKSTGISHLKIIPVGSSDLLTNKVDPEKTRTVVDTIEDIERQNIKQKLADETQQKRIQEVIAEEKEKLKDSESLISYGHLWTKYIQNRTIREHFQAIIQEHINLEKTRQDQLYVLQNKFPQYEQEWFALFSQYRSKADEQEASEQIRIYWEKFRKDVFPELYS